jgi:hypothetical protein
MMARKAIGLATELLPTSSGDRGDSQAGHGRLTMRISRHLSQQLLQGLNETSTTQIKTDNLSAGLGPRCLH